MKKQTITLPLTKWYLKNKRDLPWRKTSDPYKIWVSEIMLQQTTVSTVIPFYLRWIDTFPTIQDVANSNEQKILKMWQGLGYYNRVRNLQRSAIIICDVHKGLIPKEEEHLRKLPGFGSYTTGAVLSIAYDKKISIVDANVRRVIMRLSAIKGPAHASLDKEIHHILSEALPNKDVGTFNQALMELGALICRAKNPLCSMCPLKDLCKANALGLQEIIPEVSKKVLQNLSVVVGVFTKGTRLFMQQRASTGLLANMWEFPGGKIEKGESAEEALKRELKEELGIKIKRSKFLTKVSHFYTQFKVALSVYLCETDGILKLSASKKWLNLKELNQYPMPSGTLKVIEKIQDKIFDKRA